MLEHCLTISELISDEEYDQAKDYCVNSMPNGVDPDSEEYNNLKDKAVNETEVWGDESEYWLKVVSPSAQMNDKEWYFVLGNFLLSAVKDCNTEGDVFADSLICKAANDLLNQIDFADRHENLALALHHYKLGYMASNDDNKESAKSHYETTLQIIKQTDGLGGWHYHSLVTRDLGLTTAEISVDNDDHLVALEAINESINCLNNMSAPKSDKFVNYLESKRYEIRADMADILGKEDKKEKYMNKSEQLKA